MMGMSRGLTIALAGWAVLAAVAGPAAAAGFSVYDQGAKASALGGAFVAQADDPTAIFYNVGGLALAPKKKKVAGGLSTTYLNQAQYQGLPPGLGAGGTGDQSSGTELPAHAYVIKPIGDQGVFGVGAFQPFKLATDWANPGSFPGRTVATAASIDAYDLNPSLAWKLTPNLGIGAGVVYRLAEVSVTRRYPGTDPFNGGTIDFASLEAASDMEGGFGWNAGVLFKLGKSLSFGVAYRSAIELDLAGSGTLTAVPTGNTQLDELIAATLPLGQELAMETSLAFPDTAALGVAFAPTASSLLELDVTRTGWSDLQQIDLQFVNDSEYSRTYPLGFDDSMSYRLGFRAELPSQFELRFGVAMEETPQPSSTVGPLLADADRTVVAAGFGRDWLDVALVWQQLADRTITDSVEQLNGNYSSDLYLLAITISK
jgi:long-chain fatty acid transport protein